MTTCLVVQHLAAESAYTIAEALEGAGVRVDVCRTDLGDPVPGDASGLDALVVMGGPMSAQSDDAFPTRRAEVSLLADAVRSGLPTLGVCLGAQLLALAAGGAVSPGPEGPEIGWGPITLSDSCRADALFSGLPDELTVLHWHGDTFDLPAGATRLMSSDTYANQGFRVGQAAWGVQFHLEVTAAAVDGFLEAFSKEAAGAPGGIEGIRAATPGALAALSAARQQVFGRFTDLVLDRAARGALA
jgi:GMP synthase-like glutamine amidotransferase